MTVRLRPWRDDDALALLELYRANPDLARQMTPLTCEDDALARIDRQRDDGWAFALVLDDAPVGNVSVGYLDRTHSTGWFSYWLGAAARGRGLVKRAAATVADFALSDAPDPVFRLELGHRLDNPASGAVARAAGFVPEGVQRAKLCDDGVRHDVRTYARLRTDPRPTYAPIRLDVSGP